jgi:hypothetical protein
MYAKCCRLKVLLTIALGASNPSVLSVQTEAACEKAIMIQSAARFVIGH